MKNHYFGDISDYRKYGLLCSQIFHEQGNQQVDQERKEGGTA